MKRIVALLLCIIMSISALTGCGKDKDTNAKGDWDGKITIGIPDNALVQDYNTNKFSLWLEETTGYDIEFQVMAATSADRKSQLATMVAGGEELPDIIYNMGLSDAEIKNYGDDRYFLDLKEYLNDKEKSFPLCFNVMSLIFTFSMCEFLLNNVLEIKKSLKSFLTSRTNHQFAVPP